MLARNGPDQPDRAHRTLPVLCRGEEIALLKAHDHVARKLAGEVMNDDGIVLRSPAKRCP